MTYPQSIMTKSELIAMGWTRTDLERAMEERGQKVAWKSNPVAKNSTIKFDTEELEKWRIKQANLFSKIRNY